jgi:hypothetical protein
MRRRWGIDYDIISRMSPCGEYHTVDIGGKKAAAPLLLVTAAFLVEPPAVGWTMVEWSCPPK